jgi:hypothetical protein
MVLWKIRQVLYNVNRNIFMMVVKSMSVHEKSLNNLATGSKPKHGTPKRPRNVSLTDDGWLGLKKLALENELSLAEFLELIGRGKISTIR